jgi:2-C-methyl-D-erythritol 2,4-cyclodiphosphate synthase
MHHIRVGQGYDIHRLVPNRRLILGGIHIPHPLGLLGHSDADVLLHAVTDAILGASGLGDIGRHFPDHDPSYQGIDSRLLLRLAYEKVQQAGWSLINIDASIIAQKPKLAPYIPEMCLTIAQDLNVQQQFINIKGKTNEGLGYLGQEEAIAVHAVCLLQSKTI